jgi:hypothetical protein
VGDYDDAYKAFAYHRKRYTEKGGFSIKLHRFHFKTLQFVDAALNFGFIRLGKAQNRSVGFLPKLSGRYEGALQGFSSFEVTIDFVEKNLFGKSNRRAL